MPATWRLRSRGCFGCLALAPPTVNQPNSFVPRLESTVCRSRGDFATQPESSPLHRVLMDSNDQLELDLDSPSPRLPSAPQDNELLAMNIFDVQPFPQKSGHFSVGLREGNYGSRKEFKG